MGSEMCIRDRVKVSAGRVKVEHDDAALAAKQTGLPVREVISLAEEAWRRRGEPTVLSSAPDLESGTHDDGPEDPGIA